MALAFTSLLWLSGRAYGLVTRGLKVWFMFQNLVVVLVLVLVLICVGWITGGPVQTSIFSCTKLNTYLGRPKWYIKFKFSLCTWLKGLGLVRETFDVWTWPDWMNIVAIYSWSPGLKFTITIVNNNFTRICTAECLPHICLTILHVSAGYFWWQNEKYN